MILWLWLGAERLETAVGRHLRNDGRVSDAGAGQDVEAEVAAAFGPFVMLLGEDGADEADQGVAAGEDPDDVGAASDPAVEPFLGVAGPDLAPELLGKLVNASTSARAASRCSATLGSLSWTASTRRSYWACTDAASGWS